MIKRRKFFSKEKSKELKEYKREDKFSLISCHLGNDYCNDVLKDINRLYAESEISRINNEYLKSVEVLHEAYNKTKELNESSCIKCVHLFQSNINQTLDLMKKEIEQLTSGIFGKKNYDKAYERLCDLEKMINQA